MPRITLDAADAAELAETPQLLSDWLARDPVHLGPSWKTSSSTPGTAPPSCART